MPTEVFAPSVNVSAVPRGGGSQDPGQFYAQSFNGTIAWGSQPASFTIVYVAEQGLGAPITEGAELHVTLPVWNNGALIAHHFYGLCKTDTPMLSHTGNSRTLQFVDFREYLQWDDVYGAFNIPDVRIVNGRRLKRYKHMYPADFVSHTWTYTNAPLSAATICNAFFQSASVLTTWLAIYHDDMLDTPVFNIDCLGGKKLGAALQEISDKMGLVFGLQGGPYRLVWVRKGESGALPSMPSVSTDRTVGAALSGHPTGVRILGERNAYQVMNVTLTPDWVTGWAEFMVFDAFADDIFRRGTDAKTGQRYNALPGDPEQYIGRQLAYARAKEIQVWEYAVLRDVVPLSTDHAVTGIFFVDQRKFGGRSRMDMPAALYITTLLFRAFRPNLISFTNWTGQDVYLDSVEMLDKVLTDVWHDPATGEMFWDESIPLDGNGYAIVHGYRVGEDLFRTLRPDSFNVNTFTSAQKVWQHTPFQTDDSGEGARFLIFDEPVIVSDNLFKTVDGQTVVNANFTLSVPSAKAALCFEGERFLETYGNTNRIATESVGGLYREAVVSGGQFYEVPFADGMTASQKAAQIADALLLRQFSYYIGGYRTPILGQALTDMIDRVSVVYSPQAKYEQVDWTNERQRNAFEPERAFDRSLRSQHLLPGQEELRRDANTAKLIAASFKQNPNLARSLSDLVAGNIGPFEPLRVVFVKEPVPGTLHPVGSIVRKEPTVTTTSPNTKTQVVIGAAVTAPAALFVGVTVRDGEDPTIPFRVQATGEGLARVKGPVAVNDMLGLSTGPSTTDDGNYLIAGAGSVAKCLAPVEAGVIKLVPVSFGGGSGGGDLPVWLP